MRPRNVVASLTMAALGLTAWWLADVIPPQECPPADGTCAALEEMAYRLLAVALAFASALVPFVRIRRRGASDPPEDRFPFEGGRVGDVPDVLFD
jgi:hypothetical protein